MESASRMAMDAVTVLDGAGKQVKSVAPVRIQGSGFKGDWTVRVRYKDGSELFYMPDGKCPTYTMQQAQAFVSNNRNDYFASPDKDFIPLPDGAKAKA